MKSQDDIKQMETLKNRVSALEADSHPPVEWEAKIERIRQELDLLYEKLTRYGL